MKFNYKRKWLLENNEWIQYDKTKYNGWVRLGMIYFADPEDSDVGNIDYDHNTDIMTFTVTTSIPITSRKI